MKSSLFLYGNVAADREDNRPNVEMENIKRCPYCGEEILAVAKKCKHCGEWLDKNVAPHTHSESRNQTQHTTIGIPDKIKYSGKTSANGNPIAGKGCLIAIVVIAVIFLIIFIVNSNSGTTSNNSYTNYSDSTEVLEEFVVEEVPEDVYVEGVDYSDGVIGGYENNSNDSYDRNDYYGD